MECHFEVQPQYSGRSSISGECLRRVRYEPGTESSSVILAYEVAVANHLSIRSSQPDNSATLSPLDLQRRQYQYQSWMRVITLYRARAIENGAIATLPSLDRMSLWVKAKLVGDGATVDTAFAVA